MFSNMKDAGRSASLLPYLEDTGGASHLRFSLVSQDPVVLEKVTAPFLTVGDSGPLARLMEAEFLTDAGDALRRVFVLVQRDQYLLAEDELWPVTNLDVENVWQYAYSFFNKENNQRQLTVLSNQIEEGGRLSTLAPLFFCKMRRIFFCPPCPKCGAALQQCTDDNLLSARSLQPYSRSLKRYLYCPLCSAHDPSDFYAYELDNHDPPGLKDRRALINEFGLLPGNSNAANELPCHSCETRKECYGSNVVASSRIVPFSFYPFHMLILEAKSLHALDFLALLSGAPCEEIESRLRAKGQIGRLNCLRIVREAGLLATPFLYDHHEKLFLEVLYLKLAFLGEVARVLPTAGVFEHPNLRLSLDHIWVKLADQSGLLPSFWNFRAAPLNVSGPPAESAALPGSASNSALYFLGPVWFYTLLVNKRQDITEVSRLLKEFLSGGTSVPGPSSDAFVRYRSSAVLPPANIFWDADRHEVPKSWYGLWEKTLELGWSLWVTGGRGDPAWSQEVFLRQLADLRQEVKSTLFQEAPERYQEPYAQPLPSDDATIHDLLVKMIAKWRAKAEEEVNIGPKLKIEPIDFREQARGNVSNEHREPGTPRYPQSGPWVREMTQTVMRSAEDLKKESPPPPPAQREELLEETVMISVGSLKTGSPGKSVAEKEAGEVLPETAIIPLPKAGKQAQLVVESKQSGLQNTEKGKAKKTGGDEFLAETVILTIEKKDK